MTSAAESNNVLYGALVPRTVPMTNLQHYMIWIRVLHLDTMHSMGLEGLESDLIRKHQD